jgi:hypothetical protein
MKWELSISGNYLVFKYLDPNKYKIFERNNQLIIESTFDLISEEEELTKKIEEAEQSIRAGSRTKEEADKIIVETKELIRSEAKERATLLLTRLNSASNFCLDSTRTIRQIDFTKVEDDGRRETDHNYSADMLLVLPKNHELKQDDVALIFGLEDLASHNNKAAQKILKYGENGLNNWDAIYKIFEVIEKDLGWDVIKGFMIPGLDSNTKISHFSRSAQPDRHGTVEPFEGQMTLHDAEIVIKRLVREWALFTRKI